MHVVITAGPTREPIDDVRFLSNASTGRMGFAVAAEAARRGHRVTLVSGPVDLPDPSGVRVIRVETAIEMRDAFVAAFGEDGDACVMTAAVSDYRPRDRVAGKLKKGPENIVLELVKNPDILREAGMMARGRPVVGFALEALSGTEALAAARGKLVDKSATMIVLNGTGSLGSDAVRGVTLVTREGAVPRGDIDKAGLARELVTFLEEHHGSRGSGHGTTTGHRTDSDGRNPEGSVRV
ncbi:MAG: bifunctional phosphopantothenoylcysteine decarboxylase/phosphopantothenate--cysteine ligase CoaBC [Planctomycetota bacterium]